jgi:hypothetical protein
MNALIFDDFLPNPDIVRDWALSNTFYDSEQFSAKIGSYTSWPGQRTDHVMTLSTDYADTVLSKFADIARTCFYNCEDVSIRSYFQVCTASDGDSWVHQDNDVDIAGVLYLSKNPTDNSGTTLYSCLDETEWSKLSIEDMKKINRIERKELYNSMFKPIDIIGNVYNRLVMYRGDTWHKSNNYFGKDVYDGRLTQVFFLKFGE